MTAVEQEPLRSVTQKDVRKLLADIRVYLAFLEIAHEPDVHVPADPFTKEVPR